MILTNILKKRALLTAGAVAVVGLYACEGIKDKVMDICKKEPYKWTEQQCATAFTEGLKRNYMINVAEDAKQGGRKFEINYGSVSLEDVLSREKEIMESYRNLLDPKEKENSRFLDKTGVRKLVIEEFLVREQRVRWMNFATTFRSFVDEMRYSSSPGTETGGLSYGDLAKVNVMVNNKSDKKGAYNLRFVSPFEKLDPVELFSVAAIQAARKKGKLERVQSFRFPFYEQVQVQDPEKPNDPNARIWKHELKGVEVVAYDVNGDKKKLPDYITVTKMRGRLENGKVVFDEPSNKPSLQIFKSPGSSNPNVLVMDSDGDFYPDIVKRIFGVNKASDLLFSKKGETIDKLFAKNGGKNPDEELEGFRKGYQLPKQSFKVAKVGDNKVEAFKINDSGWPLPSHFKYKNPEGSNYKVEIVWEGPKLKKGSGNSKNAQKSIKYFKKVYHAPGNKFMKIEGNVMEYFRPPKDYSQSDIREASVSGSNNQTISIHRKGKTNEVWHIDDLLSGMPAFAIEYDKGGDKREVIMDRDGDEESNTRYESKKLFSPGNNAFSITSSSPKSVYYGPF